MSITIDVDHAGRMVRTTARGAITFSDIQSHLSDENEARGLAYPELIDATHATAAFTAAEARIIVNRLSHLAHTGALGPTAILVANDVTYGMCRMLEILLEHVCPLRPFRIGEEAEAVAWLKRNDTDHDGIGGERG